MTLRRIVPFINGVHSVKTISNLADVDNEFTRTALQHLLYYGCVKMVDIFQVLDDDLYQSQLTNSNYYF